MLCTNVLNHRMATARIDMGKYKLSIINVYMPTSKASDAEYANFLSDIEQEHRAVPKSDKLIILGDFNAKVGTPKDDDVCGGWSVGERNCRGDMVVDMCQTNDLSLVNTDFQHSRARLTTWRSPDHQTENTIHYVLTRKKDRSSVTDAIALGGADADSDHKLLKATLRWKWRSKRTSHATARVNVHALASLKEQFNNTTADYAQESDNFEQALISASKDVLTTRTANRGNKFISDETLELIGKKLAAWKRRNEPGMIELYRTLQRSVKWSLRADEEKWADNLCSNINAACDRGDAREMHKLTKELLGEKGNIRKRTIKDQHGAVIADEEGQLA